MRLSPGDIDRVDFTKADGLLPAVVQHVDSGAVLMTAYMNCDALRATFERHRVVFWSRSKQRLWEKGETSGHHLDFIAAHADCDRDALLILARPRGPVCHLGTRTCFGDERLSRAEELGFIATLEEVIERRIREPPENSYTAKLVAQGPTRIAQKVGEEGLEVAMAAATETDERVIAESADLVYHLLVLLMSRGLALEQVITELKSRHQPS